MMMSKSITIATLATLIVIGSADAQQTLPPAEFDRPYNGKLIVRIVDSDAAMHASCDNGFTDNAGCARLFAYSLPPTCIVHLRDEKAMRQHNRSQAIVLRHEIGHCNGWFSHEGAIRVDPNAPHQRGLPVYGTAQTQSLPPGFVRVPMPNNPAASLSRYNSGIIGAEMLKRGQDK